MSDAPAIIIRKNVTPADLAKRREHPGRKVGATHGSYISDLAELKKAIVLCDSCAWRFRPRTYGYLRHTKFPIVQGNCDACKKFVTRGLYFLHKSHSAFQL